MGSSGERGCQVGLGSSRSLTNGSAPAKRVGLGQDGDAKTESSLDDAGLSAYVTRDVEGRGLALAERARSP
jgi:hypothetical protein